MAEGEADVQQPADTYIYLSRFLPVYHEHSYLTSRLVLKCVASSSSRGMSVHAGRPSKVNVMMASCTQQQGSNPVLCLFRPTQQFHTVSYP